MIACLSYHYQEILFW